MMMDDRPTPRILIVDDNPQITRLLHTLLHREGYEILEASDGRVGLEQARTHLPDLIFLDLGLPSLDGYEVCRQLKDSPLTRFIPVVILTGHSGFENRLHAWEFGADEFLAKPFHATEVLTRCRSLLRIKRLIEERDSAEAVVFALARAVEAKSPYTHGHAERVTNYALMLADAVQVTREEREILRKGALLHDIGKISVPDDILNKPGALTPQELAIVREHPAQGAHIVEPLHSMRVALPLIRWHHERLDGRGYPDGLSGEEIPLLVRILSVADVYDAMSSDRPYRDGMSRERCLELLTADAAGGGLDPDLVACFRALQIPPRVAHAFETIVPATI